VDEAVPFAIMHSRALYEAASTQEEEESRWMSLALEEGGKALLRREVPVGCVLVLDGKELGRACNKSNADGNATRHAEVVLIDRLLRDAQKNRNSAEMLGNLSKAVLYVTLEPCVMCAAALSEVGVKNVVFGGSNDKFGGCGSVVLVDSEMNLKSGVNAEEAVDLLRKFYARGNPQISQTN